MAKPIATKELVFQAADAIRDEVSTPSIRNVQDRIGGGSYTTVKQHLDAWQAGQEAAAEVQAPEFVIARANELARVLWASAAREADKTAQEAREIASARVAAISEELTSAQAEIARLEQAEAAQVRLLEEATGQLAAVSEQLRAVEIVAARVPDLEARLVATGEDLAASRQEAMAKATELGRVSGEAQALRAQVAELTAALVSLKAVGPAKGKS